MRRPRGGRDGRRARRAKPECGFRTGRVAGAVRQGDRRPAASAASMARMAVSCAWPHLQRSRRGVPIHGRSGRPLPGVGRSRRHAADRGGPGGRADRRAIAACAGPPPSGPAALRSGGRTPATSPGGAPMRQAPQPRLRHTRKARERIVSSCPDGPAEPRPARFRSGRKIALPQERPFRRRRAVRPPRARDGFPESGAPGPSPAGRRRPAAAPLPRPAPDP